MLLIPNMPGRVAPVIKAVGPYRARRGSPWEMSCHSLVMIHLYAGHTIIEYIQDKESGLELLDRVLSGLLV